MLPASSANDDSSTATLAPSFSNTLRQEGALGGRVGRACWEAPVGGVLVVVGGCSWVRAGKCGLMRVGMDGCGVWVWLDGCGGRAALGGAHASSSSRESVGSRLNWYWKPEHPPGSTERRNSFAIPSAAAESGGSLSSRMRCTCRKAGDARSVIAPCSSMHEACWRKCEAPLHIEQ